MIKYKGLILEKIHFAIVRRWLTYTSRKRAIILVVHRTTAGRVWEKQYNNSPEYLYNMFELMKQRGFHFVSIEDVMNEKTLKQPAVTVVCDDGFADNLYEAIPVFRSLDIPYCIYLSAGNVLREDVTLEAIAQYMMNHPEWNSSVVKRGVTPEEDREAFEATINLVRNAETLSMIHQEKRRFFLDNNTELKEEMDHLYLSVEQVKKMVPDPLCTFGVHAYNHAPMRRMTEEELLHNTQNAKKAIEKIIGKPIKHFAYPFGGFNDNYIREFKAVKSAGFHSGVMFYNGVVTEKFRQHGYMIPRIQINPYNSIEENVKIYERLLRGR